MTQDEIIEIARQALEQEPREDWNSYAWVFADETLKAFAKLVAAKEREACEAVCNKLSANKPDEPTSFDFRYGAGCCAQAIRARGEA